jgi:uridine kinase
VPRTIDFREGLNVITRLTLELADQSPTPIILIDGRAGSGKSTFAQQLKDSLFLHGEAAPTLVSMDDLYPGWAGLKDGSLYLERSILNALAQGRKASWQSWDWARGERGNPSEPGNGWREFVGGNTLIIEGCGSLSKHSSELAQLSIWVEASERVRKQRFHERDAGLFDQYWSIWSAQEDEFYQEEKSQNLADFVIRN